MRKRAISFSDSDPAARAISFTSQIPLPKLRHLADGWLLDSEIDSHAESTLTNRRYILEKLFWFFDEKQIGCCDSSTIRQFLHYLTLPCKSDANRWGKAEGLRPGVEKLSSGTIATYHRVLHSFFNWIVAQDEVQESPMAKIRTPVDRPDQIEPFTLAEIEAIFAAARKSRAPRRDEAMLLLLFDTGMRVSELCGLLVKHVDFTARKARVTGKGGKERTLSFGRKAGRALWYYLREQEREKDSPVFLAEWGPNAGEALTRSGVEQKIRDLGIAAKIANKRCSPHTFRHTFAIEFLRNGGNQFTLMEMLGHTNIKMTQRYVAIAQADIEKQHRQFSPVDRMKK